jgi:gamma-tubulin complex component 4
VDPYQEFFIKKTEIPANNLSDAQLWQKQFVMDLNAIPVSYFPISIAESVFFIGKSMHILLKAEGFSLEEAMEIVETISNISNAPFFDVVRVENAIENIRSKVANLLYKEVVVKSTFVDYMKALKGFFLLSRGEVFQSFIEKSFVLMNGKPTHKSEEELNYTSWHQILQDYQLEDDNMSALFSIKVSKCTI